jgi:hypothetical protein
LQAYRETDYVVVSEEVGGIQGRFSLNIDVASLPLRHLYDRYRVHCAAFVTAFNDCGQPRSDNSNLSHQASLRAWLQAREYVFFPGVGKGWSGAWPEEPSFLVLAMTLRQAREVGNMYNQNAVVWCDHDAVPQLVVLR